MSCFIWRCIYVIKSLANQAEGWYSFHRQWEGGSCLIVWCGNLTILLSGLTFHCFWYRKQKTLCDSLHRPSRSDFVQLEFASQLLIFFQRSKNSNPHYNNRFIHTITLLCKILILFFILFPLVRLKVRDFSFLL